MSAEIVDFGHPKGTSANVRPRVRSPSQKSVRPNAGDSGTPAGDPIFTAIEKHRIAVQAIDDWPGDPPEELVDRSSWYRPPRCCGEMKLSLHSVLRYERNSGAASAGS
jgi:hypothetical protein